ncbi:MAG TPA: caspase family protein [Bryobacteraceae bacterium]|nr:caspase family protein [Bryobacteraceae bacterium]
MPIALHAESRRAVLVGIDNYNPDNSLRTRLQQQSLAPTPRPKVEGDPTYWRFDNLDGALNDVALMKSVLTDLGVSDFVVLRDQEASASAILGALEKNLVDDAKSGDIRIFYYSGHGNHIRNLASQEQGGEDQTIVPADNWRNVPDVRDKEISRILWRAARKGVIVTFIADSCHSGSLSRGAWNASGKVRSSSGLRGGTGGNPLREPVANDPADFDPTTKQPIDPEKSGVLTLAAAQSTEEAREVNTEDGAHGAFTWALAHALKYPGESMDRVFQRAAAELHAAGVPQQPVMGGLGRGVKDVLGRPADASAGLRILVESVTGKEVRLRGGKELGLYPDCVLKSAANQLVRLKITAAVDLGSSTAQVVGEGAVKAGDLFSVERWVTPSKATMRIFLPPAAAADTVRKTVTEVGKLRADTAIEWLADPTAGTPTRIMSWNGAAWILESNPALAKPVDLGAAPSADAVKRLLPDRTRFLLIVPPTPELIAALHPAPGVEIAKQRGDAQYWLGGRWSGEALEYAWLLPDSTDEGARQMGDRLPLPPRSDWFAGGSSEAEAQTAAVSLSEKSRLLARIRGWLTLESPPSQDSFPYHLVLRKADTGDFHTTGDLRDGETYKLYLKADEAALKAAKNLARRWVYVFVIDSFGGCTLLYPAMGRGNEGNLQPYAQLDEKPKFDPLIALPANDFGIGDPFGVDSYFLLTTVDPIDPSVFTAEGVRTRAGTRSGAPVDPLSELLSEVNTGARGVRKVETPGTWSIETYTMRSVAK